jgi:hypothetical protein
MAEAGEQYNRVRGLWSTLKQLITIETAMNPIAATVILMSPVAYRKFCRVGAEIAVCECYDDVPEC